MRKIKINKKELENYFENNKRACMLAFSLIVLSSKIKEICGFSIKEFDKWIFYQSDNLKLYDDNCVINDKNYPKFDRLAMKILRISNEITTNNKYLIDVLNYKKPGNIFFKMISEVTLTIIDNHFKNEGVKILKDNFLVEYLQLISNFIVIIGLLKSKNFNKNKEIREELLQVYDKNKIRELRRLFSYSEKIIIDPMIYDMTHSKSYYKNDLGELDYKKIDSIIL